MEERRGNVVKEHVWRIYGQSQRGEELRGGEGRWGWVGWGKVLARKWRQLYLNNNLKMWKKRKRNKIFKIKFKKELSGKKFSISSSPVLSWKCIFISVNRCVILPDFSYIYINLNNVGTHSHDCTLYIHICTPQTGLFVINVRKLYIFSAFCTYQYMSKTFSTLTHIPYFAVYNAYFFAQIF